ncbi:YafY family protein [Cytobacillus sp. IB215316]|uniref:helix-turn-helix transcriptional regulator n=1 Tax=Cytobacillus sp. IB215316 TaxID=3097354 RepID=UPI002A183D1D|nr:YafY family protein [Cytobacillus sp. IB215316]MDX8362784.1 YafY family protein [Cytobacillus sp. IB215316]
MNKSKRLVELMMVINSKRVFTAKELADEFGVSLRTIQRDLLDLQELGVPLYSEVGAGGGYKIIKERILPPIAFTENEAIAMFFANQSLQYYNDLPFETDAKSALKKFHHYLTSDVKKRIEEMEQRFVFYTQQRQQSSPCLQLLLDASINQQVVQITYDSIKGKSTRTIQPVGVFSQNGHWYCPAYCFKREDTRLFRADRIINATIVEEHEGVNLSKFNIHNWSYMGKEPEKVSLKVKLSREGVKICKNDPFLEQSIVVEQDGIGRLYTQITKPDLEYYASFFISLGKHARVEGPEQLMIEMKKILSDLNDIYL